MISDDKWHRLVLYKPLLTHLVRSDNYSDVLRIKDKFLYGSMFIVFLSVGFWEYSAIVPLRNMFYLAVAGYKKGGDKCAPLGKFRQAKP